MSLAQFLPPISGLAYNSSEFDPSSAILYARSTRSEACCPLCGVSSTKPHSYYTRKPQDLTWVGKEYRLVLSVRRFFCKENSCPQKIFVERFGEALPVYSRKTGRMLRLIEILGFALGGKAGAWVGQQIGMEISADTVVRILMNKPEQDLPTPRVLGIDDWSFRKGKTYGTILVDLEKQQPIDLLPDRESETVAAWLDEHPGVEIISRDRASAYSEAATKAAPGAIQIADRWHLLKNMGETTQRLLRGKGPLLKTATRKAYGLIEEKSSKEDEPPKKETETDKHLPPGESIRKANFEQVKIMQKAGKSVRYMHRELGIHRQTIRNYMTCKSFPHRRVAAIHYSTATPHIAFIEKRWAEGVKSPTQLWRELKEKGAKVSKSSVYRMTVRLFGMVLGPRDQQVNPPALPPILSARKTSILLSKDPDKLNQRELKFCQALKELSPEIDQAYPLIQDYVKMIKQQKVKMLDSWLEQALKSELAPMVNFATSLQQDYDAVKAALEYKWSNGQVEGQVNRLKMIKRQMYGRAGFQLLRKRVIHAPRPG